jgi:hypothetical protein
VLEAPARAGATAIDGLEGGELVAADSIIGVEFAIRDRDLFVVDLAAREDCAPQYNGSIYRDDGSMVLFFTTDHPTVGRRGRRRAPGRRVRDVPQRTRGREPLRGHGHGDLEDELNYSARQRVTVGQ